MFIFNISVIVFFEHSLLALSLMAFMFML